ncbi:Dipeptidyl-peptidase 5 [Diaporthe eres]|uniref:Dipeptidyl-peptidase V n=1 Tax=Diaporthe eres TaxID=83184 RepID=A0ABR1PCR3_DIAER
MYHSQAAIDGSIGLYTADAASLDTSSTLVATLPAPYAGLKAAQIEDGSIRFLLYAKASPDGSAYNPTQAVDPVSIGGSSARVYDSTYVRVWDDWLTPQRNAVFGGTLKSGNGSYTFDGELNNYVTGICDVTCAESPRDSGSADPNDYDLAPDGSLVVFNTQDIHLPLANYSSSQIYAVPFDGRAADAVPVNSRDGSKYPEAQGSSSSPKFSPDGSKLLYTQSNSITNGNDKTRIYIADISNTTSLITSGLDFNITRLASDWDRSPLQILGWASDSEWIYAGAPDRGAGVLFAIPITAGDSYEPFNITYGSTVLGAYALPNNTLLVTDSKFWTPCDIYSVDLDGSGTIQTYFEANKADPILSAAGLDSSTASEFYYSTNTSEIEQQAWVVYPENFDPSKKYPLALITHGGPEAASFNMWGFDGQFNFKVWADQGYVVVSPNPTGSWGWGQNLTDAAYGTWGSYIFWDIVNCWQYVKDNLPFVDVENGIHAGASFGGYMSNWIQGQDFGRKFKALVTVEGLTLTQAQGATDFLSFPFHDFLGPINSTAFRPGNPYYDFNPLLYVENWATPHIMVHNSWDYRLAESEGVMLFNLLQQNGVPSKLLNFPDEGHIIENPANQLVWYKEIFDFINHYSGADQQRPQPY